jgi:RimJ/RimL family protein N-acetyltransferase
VELRRPDPPLEDDVVRLRPWRTDDIPTIVAACNDPETIRWTTVPTPYAEADAYAWLERCERAWTEGAAPLAAVERASGDVVAAITLWLRGRTGELGYWAVPGYRGRGFVPRAVGLVCAWGFGPVGVQRMQLGTFPGNAASERVAEKCGFTREGVLRSWMEQRGVRRDVTMWSLLPGETA